MAFEQYFDNDSGYANTFSLSVPKNDGTSGMNSPSNAVSNADAELAQAEKEAAKRKRIDEIDKKITNLENQKSALQQKLNELKAKRDSMSGDDIYASGMAFGIKSEDLIPYVNTFNEGKRMKISEAQASAFAQSNVIGSAKATEEEKARKKQEILDLEKDLNDPKFTKHSVEEDKYLESQFKALMNRYEDAIKGYDALSEEKYKKMPFEFVSVTNQDKVGEDSNGSQNISSKTLNERQRNFAEPEELTKLDDPNAKEQEKKLIIDGIQKRINKKDEEERSVIKARNSIISQAKNANLSPNAKDALVTKYRNTFKKNKPTREQARKTLFGE